jgi:N utilization substance protein B
MANRHLLRSLSMQTLYQIDMREQFDNPKVWEEIVQPSIDALDFEIEDLSYLKEVVSGVLKYKKEIDKLITTYSNGWSITKMAPIDRNILRVAIYEMNWYKDDDIPKKVSINEAIELAKNFSGKVSGKFVNGVLGGFFKGEYDNINEEEKEDASQKANLIPPKESKKETIKENKVVKEKPKDSK